MPESIDTRLDREAIAYEVAEEIEDACLELLGRDIGTIHRQEIGARALGRAASLLADAIEAQLLRESVWPPIDEVWNDAVSRAAHRVRSFLPPTTEEEK